MIVYLRRKELCWPARPCWPDSYPTRKSFGFGRIRRDEHRPVRSVMLCRGRRGRNVRVLVAGIKAVSHKNNSRNLYLN
jgi:hypothetical protein